jgi:GDP-L-fucose synthase
MNKTNESDKIFIAGHNGMVGSAIFRQLEIAGFTRIITKDRKELNLIKEQDVTAFFDEIRPDVVIIAAARVGGIQANIDSPADFLYENLAIQNNIIHNANLSNVKKLIFLGSSCIYPKECPQPMSEEYLLTGPLEPTNEGYALAKIAGLKLVEFYAQQYELDGLTLLPCNLYGTNDHFDLKNSHVLSSLVKRFCDAIDDKMTEVMLWGTGKAKREFMHVDDFARSVLYFIQNPPPHRLLNVGVGEDVSIYQLAKMISRAAGYAGKILWDDTKPEGMLRKCMDISRQKELGFVAKVSLEEGINKSIVEYRDLKRKGL